ncbi:hypothetical protein GCM10017776_44350 [Streptomyces griseoluteus]|nr:hypothetical protein GCM10017776_44350 [Streptomyces griseoluteus]
MLSSVPARTDNRTIIIASHAHRNGTPDSDLPAQAGARMDEGPDGRSVRPLAHGYALR